MKYVMDNSELQEAIDKTIDHIKNTPQRNQRYVPLNNHLFELLELQRGRAGLAKIEDASSCEEDLNGDHL